MAPVRFDDRRPTDSDCGRVRGIDVRLRDGVSMWPALLDCDRARSSVAQAIDASKLGLREPWLVVFSASPAGWFVGADFRSSYAIGMTYPATHGIVVRAGRGDVLAHELGHAYDVEHGLPNGRD